MKENLQKAIEFAEQINNIDGILSVVLFGSVATGEDTKASDIDVAIIHNRNDEFKLRKEINRIRVERIQTTLIHIKKLPSETEIVGAISGEGFLLYGRPIEIKEEKVKIIPKSLLIYSLSEVEQKNKAKVTRALYGYVSKSRYRDKEYVTKSLGLAKEVGVEKLTDTVLLVERRKSFKFKNLFKRFNIPYREISIWTY